METNRAELKSTLVVILIAPLSTAALFMFNAFIDAPDNLLMLIAVVGAIIFYGLALVVTLFVFLPVHLAMRGRVWSRWWYVPIGGVISVCLFVAYSLFTGGFGPPREWLWIPVYGAVLGATFGALVHRFRPSP